MFQYDLQGAIYDAIKADALITEETYDFVPEGVPGPYLVIGDSDMIPWDDKLAKGGEITETIHVWADGTKKRRVKFIIGRLEADLATDLTVGARMFRLHRVQRMQVLHETPDLVRGTITLVYRAEE